MKQSKQYIALFLIPLILFSSIGFSVEAHFCQGELKSAGLFKASVCEMEKEFPGGNAAGQQDAVPPCHRKKGCKGMRNRKDGEKTIGKPLCCYNEVYTYMVDAESISVKEFILSRDILQTVSVLEVLYSPLIHAEKTGVDLQYVPPPLICDLSVRLQVFRI